MELMRGRRGHLADAALAAGGLLYSGTLAALSFQYTIEARVFALAAAAAGIATAIAYLVSSVRSYAAAPADPARTAEERAETSQTWMRLVSASALVVVSTPFLYLFGVHAYTFAMTLVFLRVFGGQAWRAASAVAVGLTVFNYVLFTIVFDLKFDAVGVLLP